MEQGILMEPKWKYSMHYTDSHYWATFEHVSYLNVSSFNTKWGYTLLGAPLMLGRAPLFNDRSTLLTKDLVIWTFHGTPRFHNTLIEKGWPILSWIDILVSSTALCTGYLQYSDDVPWLCQLKRTHTHIGFIFFASIEYICNKCIAQWDFAS